MKIYDSSRQAGRQETFIPNRTLDLSFLVNIIFLAVRGRRRRNIRKQSKDDRRRHKT
jgi:hypothetical protein